MDGPARPGMRQEVYSYEAPWCIYGLAASQRAGSEYRFAIGSYVEEYSNKVQVCAPRRTRLNLSAACGGSLSAQSAPLSVLLLAGMQYNAHHAAYSEEC